MKPIDRRDFLASVAFAGMSLPGRAAQDAVKADRGRGKGQVARSIWRLAGG